MELSLDIYHTLRDFLERGGDTLMVIVATVLVMWTLILNRLMYLWTEHPLEVARGLTTWKSRRNPGSWHSEQLFVGMVSRLAIRAHAGLAMIKTLAGLCPLLGLLGTVMGMIAIFDAMSIIGSGSSRAVAGGVSTAIVTTMAGIVGAISGIFPAALLLRTARARMAALQLGRSNLSELPAARPGFRIPRAVRYGTAPMGSIVITVGILLMMERMILTGEAALTDTTRGYPVTFVRVEREEIVARADRKPEPPPQPEEKPEWTPERSSSNLTKNALLIAAPGHLGEFVAMQTIRGFGGSISDGDYLPILKVAPVYPRRAEERHLEGWVLLTFTLGTTGMVRDIEVLESSDPVFERPAIAATSKFKYRPRVINGEPIEVRGVVNRIVFELPEA